MRSEGETRVGRFKTLLIDGGLCAALLLALIALNPRFPEPWVSFFDMFMITLIGFVGLHFLRVMFLVLRDWRGRTSMQTERETRIARFKLLALNGGLCLALWTLVFVFDPRIPDTSLLFDFVSAMWIWFGIVGLHFLTVLFLELRDWRRRRHYGSGKGKNKRKHEQYLSFADGDQLIDFPGLPEWQDAEVKAKRSS